MFRLRSYCYLLLILIVLLATSCNSPTGKGAEKQDFVKLSDRESGYTASVQDWVAFLRCWSEVPNDGVRKSRLAFRDWLGAGVDGSFVVEVGGVEQSVPKSISDFVIAIRRIEADEPKILEAIPITVERVSPELALYRAADHEDWTFWSESASADVSDEQYYRYDFSSEAEGKQDPVFFRRADLDYLLYVADFHHLGRLLVNTNEQTMDGEWEAWNLSWRLPGAVRYPSFADMIQALYVEHAVPDAATVGPYSEETLRNSCAGHVRRLRKLGNAQ